MEKKRIITFSIILLLFGGLLIFLYFAQGKITGFSVYEQSTQSNFDEGVYSNSAWNGSAVVLNSGQISGNYLSKIFDAAGSSTWNNISWTSNAIGELPSNGATETKWGSGNANMAGNVLLLHLNETSGTLTDSSGNSNTGTNFGGTYGAVGKFGKAMSFDASAERVEVANSKSVNILGDITVSTWIKPASNTHNSWNYFASHTGNVKYELGVYNSGLNPRWKVYNSSGASTEISAGTMTVGNWHNVVGVRSGTSILLYLNGVQVASSSSFVGNLRNSTSVVVIGGSSGSAYFNGTLDEFAIWNRSLSAQEITDIYKRGATRLNLSVQSCDDSACSGESFSDIGDDSSQSLSVANNQYFQYKFAFESDNKSYTPELYNATIDYTLNNVAPTWSNLNDNETSETPKKNDIIQMNVSLNDDINLSNYIFSWNDSGSWVNDSVILLSSNQTTVSVNKTLTASKGTLVNYRFYFNDSNGVNNQTDIGTFNVKNTLPTIPSLDLLANNTITNDNTPFFNWSVSSDIDGDTITYHIQIDNDINFNSLENESTTADNNITPSVLSDGTYYWHVRAETSDANSSYSVVRVFSVDTSTPNEGGGSSGGGGGSSSSKKLNSSKTEILENNKTSNTNNSLSNLVNEQIELSLIDVNRRKGFIDAEYLVKNLAEEDKEVELYFSILDFNENIKSEINETRFISANSEKTFGTTLHIDENLDEELILIIDFKKYSSFISGDSPIRSLVSGFSILPAEKNKNNLIKIISLSLLFFIFVFFVLYKIVKRKER